MTNMIPMCFSFHKVRAFIMNTRPDEILAFGMWFPMPDVTRERQIYRQMKGEESSDEGSLRLVYITPEKFSRSAA
jgi:hypothetical protein